MSELDNSFTQDSANRFHNIEQELQNEHKAALGKRLIETSIKTHFEQNADNPLNLSRFFKATDLAPKEDHVGDTTSAQNIESIATNLEANAEKAGKSSRELRAQFEKLVRLNLLSTARTAHAIDKEQLADRLLLSKEINLLRTANPFDTRDEITDFLRDEISQLDSVRETLKDSSPEAYVYLNGLELRKNISEVRQGKLITTPYVSQKLSQLKRNMDEGSPSFIHGELGTGKTELAITAAKESLISRSALQQAETDFSEYSKNHPDLSHLDSRKKLGQLYLRARHSIENSLQNGEVVASEKYTPLLISGSQDFTSQDLYADKTLKLTKFNGKPLLEHKVDLDREIATWQDKHRAELEQLPAEERATKERSAANQILELYKLKNAAFGTEVETVKKEIYRGVVEGRPVIIDEVNAIPAAVLISLNDILQRRPGQNCYIPGVGQTKIAPGFSITMTGNITSNATEYFGTNDLNPAFLSRLQSIDYDYLPQSKEDISYHEQLNPNKNELFRITLSYLADRHGDIKIPEPDTSLEKLFKLCQFARTTQDIFSGKWAESDVNQSASGDEIVPRLENSVLSIRNLLSVLKEWDRGSDKDLDMALWDGFISHVINPDDQNLLLTQAKRFNFFQAQEGWNIQPKPIGSSLSTFDELRTRPYDYHRQPLEVVPLSETVDILFGTHPERKIYPISIDFDDPELTDDDFDLENYINATERLSALHKSVSALEALFSKAGCSIQKAS